MPRKAKEKIDENGIIIEKNVVAKDSSDSEGKKTSTKKSTISKKSSSTSTTKKTTSSKKKTSTVLPELDTEKVIDDKGTKKTTKTSSTSSRKKPSSKKSSAKSTETEKSTEKSEKKATKKATKKSTTTSTTRAKTSSKTTSGKKTTTRKKSTSTKKVNETENSPVQITEYYDLPYKYGNTVVKILAQTPKTLFVYWEVSDVDIENMKKNYGENFFEITKPIIIVHNITLDKTYEVEINDFANCWYLNTEDSDCKFDIELARRFIKDSSTSIDNNSDYLYIAESNELEAPNDHILFEKIKEFVIFRNTNNDNVIKKSVKSFKFLKDIYKFYKDMYDDEILKNPSSQFKF